MSPRAAAARKAAFDRSAYERKLGALISQREEELYQHGAGLHDELALGPIYERHASLFDRSVVDALRRLVEAGGPESGHNRALLAAATDGYIERVTAELTDALGTAEATAVVVWRGESIPYRGLRNRISEISGRAERNGLYASYLEAEEALNPMRRERFDRIGELARELGYADYVELIKTTRGYDPDGLGASVRDFLEESETPYFAALRRYLARIEIEQGDASLADLWYLMRGSGWDNWFDGRRILTVLASTLRGLGIELADQPGATLDVDARPNKSPLAFVAVIDAPRDVRLVIQPHGGWDVTTEPGQAFLVVTVVNTGMAFWPSGTGFPFPQGVVTVAPYALGTEGERIELGRTELPHGVSPGQSVAVLIRAPREAIENREVRVDLVREGLAWFSELGSEPLVVPAEG